MMRLFPYIALRLSCLLFFCNIANPLKAQQSIFSLFEDQVKMADYAYINKDYEKALNLYKEINKQPNKPSNIALRLARSYFLTGHYTKSVEHYDKFVKDGNALQRTDQLYLVEALVSINRMDSALLILEKELELNDGTDSEINQKIWQINNSKYLYEDSLKNVIHFSELNSAASILQMKRSDNNKVLFVSNRPTIDFIDRRNGSNENPFFKLFQTAYYEDPFSLAAVNFDQKKIKEIDLNTPYNIVAFCEFNNGKSLIFAANNPTRNAKGRSVLNLFFAKKIGHKWVKSSEFEHNSLKYSFSEPTINNEGTVLYFVSEQQEGVGGKDIYRSVLTNEGWSKPSCLRETINSTRDERYPHLFEDKILYFSSNGKNGLGGFDIYKAAFSNGNFSKVENMGYPINSSLDELSFTVDSLGQEGFLTSNRIKQGKNFDLYELALDLQSYPLKVSGSVNYIEHNWMDSTELEVLPNVTMQLVDINRGGVVAETSTDSDGLFHLTVPYYSKYKIRISGEDLDGFVSFEVPKFAKQDLSYEIVVVNDDFKNSVREYNE